MDPMKKRISLTLLVAAFYLLHQDFWNWEKIHPLVLGFLPVGLAYHVGYSLLAAALMAVMVRSAWPDDLDPVEAPPAGPGRSKEDPT